MLDGLGSALGVATLGQGVWEAEAVALFARFTTPPDGGRRVVINNLIRTLKAAGIWTKLDALYLMAAADSQAARRNWIADQYNLTAVSSPTFTADRGYKGDGTGAYLDTGFNLQLATKLSQNNAEISYWIETLSTIDFRRFFGNAGSAPMFTSYKNGTQIDAYVNSDTGQVVSGAGGQSHITGLTAHARVSSSTGRGYINGGAGASGAATSGAVPAGAMRILADTSGRYNDARLASFSIGGDLTDAENLALYNAMRTYMTAVGVA